MSELIAIVYPSYQRAQAVLATMQRREDAHRLDLDDACVVTKADDDRIGLHHTVSLSGRSAGSGDFWSGLLAPLRAVAEPMPRGSSAIVVLARRASPGELERAFAQFGGRVRRTPFGFEPDGRLRRAPAPLPTPA